MSKRLLSEKLFGTWANVMLPFVESEEWDKLMADLKASKAAGGEILPAQANIFRAFTTVPWSEVKVVVCGPEPYYIPSDGANGLAFSVDRQEKPPAALSLILDTVEREMYDGLNLNKLEWPLDLSHWTSQGVLLLNAALTVKAGEPGSHKKIWEPFTAYVIKTMNKLTRNMIFIGWGSQAQDMLAYVTPFDHYILSAEHPAKALHEKRPWKNGTFREAAAIYERVHKTQLKW